MWNKYNSVKPSLHSATVLNVDKSSSFQVYTGVSEPIALTSNYYFGVNNSQVLTEKGKELVDEDAIYYYSRSRSPNFNSIQDTFLNLHGGGSGAVAFSTGMAAISAVIMSLTTAESELVVSDEIYREVPELYENLLKSKRLAAVHVVDILDTDAVMEKIKNESVKMLYLESASNPNMKIPDFEALLSGARKHNPNCVIVVDNTLLTPILFRPFEWGVDIVVESATKYLSGKGDVLLGLVATRGSEGPDKYRLKGMHEKVLNWRMIAGGSPNPLACWLVMKGIETLQLRMLHVSKTALKVAKFLESLPCVSRVIYSGLKSHPCYSEDKKYCPSGSAGLMRFHIPLLDPKDYTALEADRAPFVNAVSFGEAHTLMMCGYDGDNLVFKHEKTKDAPRMNGFWYRLAIGLQTSDEICHGFLNLFARHESTRVLLGQVERVKEGKHGVSLKIKLLGPKAARSPIDSNSCVYLETDKKSFRFIGFSGEPKISSSSVEMILDEESVADHQLMQTLKDSTVKDHKDAKPLRVFRLRTTDEVRQGPLSL